MTDKIQRYNIDAPDGFFDYEDNDGDYVKYKDHLKAIEAKQVEIRKLKQINLGCDDFIQMQKNALEKEEKTIEAQAKEIKRLEKEFKNRGGKLAQMTYLVKLKYGNKDERIWELICETEKELGLTK